MRPGFLFFSGSLHVPRCRENILYLPPRTAWRTTTATRIHQAAEMGNKKIIVRNGKSPRHDEIKNLDDLLSTFAIGGLMSAPLRKEINCEGRG